MSLGLDRGQPSPAPHRPGVVTSKQSAKDGASERGMAVCMGPWHSTNDAEIEEGAQASLQSAVTESKFHLTAQKAPSCYTEPQALYGHGHTLFLSVRKEKESV